MTSFAELLVLSLKSCQRPCAPSSQTDGAKLPYTNSMWALMCGICLSDYPYYTYWGLVTSSKRASLLSEHVGRPTGGGRQRVCRFHSIVAPSVNMQNSGVQTCCIESQLDQSLVWFPALCKVLLIQSRHLTEIPDIGHDWAVTLVYHFAFMIAWTLEIHRLPDIAEKNH